MLSEKNESLKLAEILRQARKNAGLTMREASERLHAAGFGNKNHVIIQKVESNQRRVDVVEFGRFCAAYDIDPVNTLSELVNTVGE